MSASKTPMDAKDLADELKALRKQVSELQSAMERRQAPRKGMRPKKQGSGGMPAMRGMNRTPPMGTAPAMPMEDDMDMMGSMESMPKSAPAAGSMAAGSMAMDAAEMSGMGGMGAGTAPMRSGAGGTAMAQGSGMSAMGCCMGEMGGMGSANAMQSPTSLPGFPGRSHIYHIGAEGFFLNHSDHITLTLDQQTRLNQIQEKALLEGATYDRKVAEAEQQMFVLTGTDQPDAAKIETQLRSIEALRMQQRMAFIRAVGEAAQVLTEPQREVLLGKSSPPDPKKM